MKKSLFIFAMFCLTVLVLDAQNPLPKGGAQLNAGVGFSGWGIPLYVGFDYGVHQDVTVGAEVSYRRYQYGNSGHNNERYSYGIWGFLGNANFHFSRVLGIPKKWDLYAGLNVGFYLWTSNSNYNNTGTTSGLGLGGQIGARYYFTDQFAINLEGGGGSRTSGGKIGITYKF